MKSFLVLFIAVFLLVGCAPTTMQGSNDISADESVSGNDATYQSGYIWETRKVDADYREVYKRISWCLSKCNAIIADEYNSYYYKEGRFNVMVKYKFGELSREGTLGTINVDGLEDGTTLVRVSTSSYFDGILNYPNGDLRTMWLEWAEGKTQCLPNLLIGKFNSFRCNCIRY